MLLGIDIGTSVIKAALFDDVGCELADASQRVRLLDGPVGWSEFDGNDVWQAVISVVNQLFKSSIFSPADVSGVGVTGVMVGAWLIDEQGALVRPPILWNDARAQSLVDQKLEDTPDLFSRIFDHSGSTMQLGCTLTVLAWLKQHEPESLERTSHVLCAKDFIRYQLTGKIATDESEAAMAPGSAVTRGFHNVPARLLGVEELTSLLAPVRRAETLAGEICPEAAALTGLKAGTPVAIGTGDTGSCVIGAGCYEPRQAVTILGTTCLNGVLFDHAVYEPKDLGLLFILPGQRWMKAIPNVAGTTVLDWALNTLCPDIASKADPYEVLGRLAETSPAGANGVIFVPYLSASGVIAPKVEPRARAGFYGLAPHHTRADMVRAIYEGMAYSIRDSYASIGSQIDRMRLGGGGARSAFWSQMIADVTGFPVEIPKGTQFGAKGAALCVATAIGMFSSISEACAATYVPQRQHTPNIAHTDAYEVGFRRFKIASAAALGPLTELIE